MNLPFTIAIENPCNENWDQMQSHGCGRFCGVCETTVLDFTNFTDAEFIRFFQEKDEREPLCAKLTKRQLAMTIPPKLKPVVFWRPGRFAAASLFAALSFTPKAEAQAEPQLKTAVSSIFQAKPESALYEKLMVIKGTVHDHDNQPLAGAWLEVLNTPFNTTTDDKGRFMLELQEQDRGCVLVCTAAGRARQEIILQQPGNLNILMKEEYGYNIMGSVATPTAKPLQRKTPDPNLIKTLPGTTVQHKTFWQRITRPLHRTKKG